RAGLPARGGAPGFARNRATWQAVLPGHSARGKIGPGHRPSAARRFAWNALAKMRTPPPVPRGSAGARPYLPASASAGGCSPAFLRLSQLYFFWNFSIRPVVSMYFILPVKNGWQAEQISTVMFFLVLRVENLLPQPQVTVAVSYLG